MGPRELEPVEHFGHEAICDIAQLVRSQDAIVTEPRAGSIDQETAESVEMRDERGPSAPRIRGAVNEQDRIAFTKILNPNICLGAREMDAPFSRRASKRPPEDLLGGAVVGLVWHLDQTLASVETVLVTRGAVVDRVLPPSPVDGGDGQHRDTVESSARSDTVDAHKLRCKRCSCALEPRRGARLLWDRRFEVPR